MVHRNLKRNALTATGAAALLMLSQAAAHATIVGTIIGAYDASNNSNGLENGTTLKFYANNGGGGGDTPNLFILNPNGVSMTNVTLTLTGYQDVAGGNNTAATFTAGAPAPVVQTIDIGNIAANTVYQFAWDGQGNAPTGGGSIPLNLAASDYDDQLGNAATPGDFRSPASTDSSGDYCGEPGSGAPTTICSFVGNFSVDFEADLSTVPGGHVSSVFSNLAFGTSAFVGWEGLDPDGLSETKYDAHSGTFPGTLAVIQTGTGVVGGGTGPAVPEPGTLSLLGAGLGALGLLRRRRKTI